MRYFSAQVGANDNSGSLQFAETLGKHFFRCLREQSAQFAESRRTFLKPAEYADFPLSLKQSKRKSDRSLFLRRKLAAFRN